VQRLSRTWCSRPSPALIALLAHFTELVPGDVIVTGHHRRRRAYRTPRLSGMREVDVGEVEVSGIGILRNPGRTKPAAGGDARRLEPLSVRRVFFITRTGNPTPG